jgi:prophage antirepressor-like protein
MTVFEKREVLGKEFRIYGTPNEPLFLAKDVTSWIEHNKPSELINSVDSSEKLKAIISHSGQNRDMWFLTEDGLYEVLMQSRKPIAKQFKKQVKQILKDIRMHGAYLTPETIKKVIHDPDVIIDLAMRLKAETEKRESLELKDAQNQQVIQEIKPKATYYDLILQNKGTVPIKQISADYGMTAQEMNRTLHDLGVQYKIRNTWILYKEYSDKGYTQSRTHLFNKDVNTMHTYWTQKGRLFIYDILKNKKGILPVIERSQNIA